jgi:hypothetical protein
MKRETAGKTEPSLPIFGVKLFRPLAFYGSEDYVTLEEFVAGD